jgi:hypothetical protein
MAGSQSARSRAQTGSRGSAKVAHSLVATDRGITEFRGNPEGDWRVLVVKEDTEFYLWRQGEMEIWLGFLDGRLVHKFFYVSVFTGRG